MCAENTGITFALKQRKRIEFLSLSNRIFHIIDCRNNESSKIDWALRSKKIQVECQELYGVIVF
jgi:hypothetical protein